MRHRQFLLTIPTILVPLIAATPLAAADGPTIPFERYRLDNGLTVILHEDHRLPVVAVNLWYRVGSKDEPPDRSGFAHLFEHLMFMGTRSVPVGEFDRVMERSGGSNNATTSQDRTNYFESGPSNLLETFLFLESDRLRTLGRDITRKKLDLQRDVVRNERRQNYEDRPYGKAYLEMAPSLYPPGHPYHHPVIGSHEDLENATVEDVRQFFARFYVPANVSLVVAGDFEPARARAWIQKYFGDIPAGAEPEHAVAAPVRLDQPSLRTIEDQRVQLPRTMLLHHSPPFYADGDADLDVLGSVLGDEKTGRLYRRLVYEKELAQDVSAGQWSSMLASVFVIQVTARPGVELEAIEREVDDVIKGLRDDPPTERECARARNGIEMSFWHGVESVASRADLLNQYQFYLGDPGALARDIERYRKLTPRSVLRWSDEVLRPDGRVTLRIVPASAGDAAASETGGGR